MKKINQWLLWLELSTSAKLVISDFIWDFSQLFSRNYINSITVINLFSRPKRECLWMCSSKNNAHKTSWRNCLRSPLRLLFTHIWQYVNLCSEHRMDLFIFLQTAKFVTPFTLWIHPFNSSRVRDILLQSLAIRDKKSLKGDRNWAQMLCLRQLISMRGITEHHRRFF